MNFEVKIEGLDRIANATREVQQGKPDDKPPMHNGKRIAAVLEAALAEMERKGMVREHGE